MKYFAYGSNMNPDRMKKRKIKLSELEHATLKGWRLEFNNVLIEMLKKVMIIQ